MYISYKVKPEDAGKRAETILKNKLHFSNKFCKRIRNNSALRNNGEWFHNKAKVKTGDFLEVDYTEEDELTGPVENMAGFEIVYEDEWLVIVNKPANLPTHERFPGDKSLLSGISNKNLRACNRLDRGTSGLVILAKNAYMQNLIQHTEIKKLYLALVHGIFSPEDGTISYPIGREEHTIIFRKVRADGKEAITHYRTLESFADSKASLVAFLLETGRTHQIRVHSRYEGHPLVGDNMYGWEQTVRYKPEIHDGKLSYRLQADHRDFRDETVARDFEALALDREIHEQFLHAYILEFTHPLSKEHLKLKAKLPRAKANLLAKLRAHNDSKFKEEKLEELLNIEVGPSLKE